VFGAEAEFGTLLVAGFVAGVLCGLVPLIYGLIRARRELALLGLGASALAGLVLGLILAIPVAGIFVFLIYRSTHPRAAATPERNARWENKRGPEGPRVNGR
jgi:hypothetical protein